MPLLTRHITGKKKSDSLQRTSSIGGTGKVPHAKKPRSRPRTGARDKVRFLNGTLPAYSGPYNVGCMDIEVPAKHPRTFSNITRKGRHLLQLETVLFTLYYPAALGFENGRDPAGHKTWSRETWLPRPRAETAKGYGRFAGLPDFVSLSWFAATTMLTKIRAFRNAPLARHWPPEEGTSTGHQRRDQQGPPPPGRTDEPHFPLLFFSHGLGGTRTAYSTICGEFASYGFVVCAVEHRDGSGPRTFIDHAKKGEGRQDEGQDEGAVDHLHQELAQSYDTIDYIFPKDNPLDTSPGNAQGVDSELRLAQIQLRLAEFEEAYRVLCEICRGNGEEIARQNLRRRGYVGASSRGLDGIDWAAWTGRFHTDKITAAGHSFGAATVVEALRNADRFKHVQAGIIYDIWGAPIKPPEDDERHRIHAPLLGINSEAFMYWQTNFDKVKSLMEEAKEQGAPAFLLTVRGAIHLSQSDFSILYRHVCSFFLKATVHPERAIDLNVSASLEFLREVTSGAGKTIIERCLTDEKLLQTPLLEPDEIPDAHKPNDEFIAKKLEVKHEFRTRMSAKIQRKMKRAKKHGFYKPGDEVWMHFKPEVEELSNWQKQTLAAEEISRESSARTETG
ncbi:hypothetical protein M011DRAFT_252630 [Sporormia fimetaria CBS 119925]|uniref:1-alkyl-2-acetylglycerophosphocholine esterase n=1 Tax=Sporormia fimetaria CBS 119925 TaxID=1340428 RepID=A0A6A6UXP7_9PLEO|nr:hypothetical protein M011DRAFT_252630 [Sporormia fimetaria CBS 119925]